MFPLPEARDDSRFFHFSPKDELDPERVGSFHVGTGRAAYDRAAGKEGTAFVGRIKAEMLNTPDTAIPDSHANAITGAGTRDENNYIGDAKRDWLLDRGWPEDPQKSTPVWERENYTSYGGKAAWRGLIDKERQNTEGRGLYYQNKVEDPGSVSAVLPSSKEFEVEQSLKVSSSSKYPKRQNYPIGKQLSLFGGRGL